MNCIFFSFEGSNTSAHSGKGRQIPVYVNVYDMLPRRTITEVAYKFGVGVFHSGVEVLGREYNFGGSDDDFTGVFELPPRIGPPNVTYKDSILIGYTDYDKEEIKNIIGEISKEWKGNTYRLLTRNCNHFTNELCLRLVGKATPNWINRAARFGSYFPCVVPTSGWIDPPESETSDLDCKSQLGSANIYTLLTASPFSSQPSTPSSETPYRPYNMLDQIIKK